MSERLSDYDFDLPDQLIALRPVQPRPASRLLVAGPDQITDVHVHDLGHYLRAGDLLVLNNTKVIPARLRGTRFRKTIHGSGSAKIEVTLIGPGLNGHWKALARPAKRLNVGEDIVFADDVSATVIEKAGGGEVLLEFDIQGTDLYPILDRLGEMPLPPYIAGKRAADAQDREDYQTVFASVPGALAAPTASLHYDQGLLDGLGAQGVGSCEVTLHVGAGTFLPVKTDDISVHKMHSEWGEVSSAAAAQIAQTRANGGRVIPVGTTALRLIETAATAKGQISEWSGDTDIFIRPGYEFLVTDGLMTNFHLPKSTLMMLVSALMGRERINEIYQHAIANEYRFFSYGDSSLLLPAN